MGTLYLVATPIGNLEDITLRALRVLGEVQLIAAEDTRSARRLLSHFELSGAKLLSYTEANRRARIPAILSALRDGDVALISEAGMPAISDPGVHLVDAVSAAGHTVVPVPGASALTAAIAVSGLPSRWFRYLGFLPRKSAQRRRLLEGLADATETLVAFEAPHRMRASLKDLLEMLGDRRIAVCRELTKLHEEVFRGVLSAAIEHFVSPRGEFTLVIEGAGQSTQKPVADAEVDAELRELRAAGARAREAVRAVAERSGLSHRKVYRRWLSLGDKRE